MRTLIFGILLAATIPASAAEQQVCTQRPDGSVYCQMVYVPDPPAPYPPNANICALGQRDMGQRGCQ
jgi:hypothetical protein